MADNQKMCDWFDRQLVTVNDMVTERNYMTNRIGNIFSRALGDGVISDLQVTDNSYAVYQTGSNTSFNMNSSTHSTYICQVFQATTNNIQLINLNGYQSSADGNLMVSIYSLINPTEITTTPILNDLIGQIPIPFGSLPTGSANTIPVNFSGQTRVTTPGSFIVGNYYAIVINRDGLSGSIYVSYNNTPIIFNGGIFELAESIYNYDLTWNLYFQIYSDAVQVSTGYAYKNGNPIEVDVVTNYVNLVDTTGTTNYICIAYNQVPTDYITAPRTGILTASRLQDEFVINVYNSQALIQPTTDLLLATTIHTGSYPLIIQDLREYIPNTSLWSRNVKSYEFIGGIVNYSFTANSVPMEILFFCILDNQKLQIPNSGDYFKVDLWYAPNDFTTSSPPSSYGELGSSEMYTTNIGGYSYIVSRCNFFARFVIPPYETYYFTQDGLSSIDRTEVITIG